MAPHDKERKSHHTKHTKHTKHKKHKKHKKPKHKKRRRKQTRGPTDLPSAPTLEQNQYWLLHGRIANLEAQGLQQQGGPVAQAEKKMSRAEEIDIANTVIDENLKRERERDNVRSHPVQNDALQDQSLQAQGGDDQDSSLRLSPAKESPRADEFLARMDNAELEGDYSDSREPEPAHYYPEYQHKTVTTSKLEQPNPQEFFKDPGNFGEERANSRAAKLQAMSEGGGGGSPRFQRLRGEGIDERTARQIDEGLIKSP
jgi:hypothetical protein